MKELFFRHYSYILSFDWCIFLGSILSVSRNESETTRGSVSVSFRFEGKSGSRAARRFRFRFVSSGARFRETGFAFTVLSVTLCSDHPG